MAAGDLIDAYNGDYCYLAEYGGVLLGDGTPWVITDLDGPGNVSNHLVTHAPDMHPALWLGTSMTRPGGIVFTLHPSKGATAAAMESSLATLETLWSITPTTSPVDLHLLLPGRGHVIATGIPDQLATTRIFAGGGIASVVASFAQTTVGLTAATPGGS